MKTDLLSIPPFFRSAFHYFGKPIYETCSRALGRWEAIYSLAFFISLLTCRCTIGSNQNKEEDALRQDADITACLSEDCLQIIKDGGLVSDATECLSEDCPKFFQDGGLFDCSTKVQQDASRISLRGLLFQMIDLDQLTRIPYVSYISRLSSSHNRISDDSEPGSEDWFAGKDFAEFEEGEPYVLLDVTTPGVITRIWSANPSGSIRIYIDGSNRPAIEAPTKDLLSGKVNPFTAPFGFIAAEGHNLYFPIAFQKGCRITVTSDEQKMYYQVTYRKYEDNVAVESFSQAIIDATNCERQLVAERLTKLTPDIQAILAGEKVSFRLDTENSATDEYLLIADTRGSVIRELRILTSTTDEEVLRGTILSLSFDDNETVRVPLGDFFGSGPGIQEVNSLPLGVSKEGEFLSRWPMPFERQARIAIESANEKSISASIDLTYESYVWDERSLYFNARWRAPEWLETQILQDWNLARITGEGLYVGNMLNVTNRSVSWWGEGDEKIWVDFEEFPSHFGTGTEDYYGYAWCSNERFSLPYIGQPRAGTRKNWGHLSLYRWHILDPIPFNRELRFDLEVDHWDESTEIALDSVSYWYARPGSVADGVASNPSEFLIPEIGVPEPDTTEKGPYRCGL